MSGANRRGNYHLGSEILVEACATSPLEARSAFDAGAGRVELCSVLEVGGLTPSVDHVGKALQGRKGPVFAMVRPNPGTFRVPPAEITVMRRQVQEMVDLGADGVVLGVLDQRGRIDLPALTELVAAAGGAPVTFHRAFDQLEDPLGGIEGLVESGVQRVLTSGGRATAWEGRAILGQLVAAAAGQITVMGGGRVRGDHVGRLVEETGLREVHARAEAVAQVVEGLRPRGRKPGNPGQPPTHGSLPKR